MSKKTHQLIDDLKSRDYLTAMKAAKSLGEIGDPGTVPVLIDALLGTDTWVSMTVAEALGRIGDSRAVPALLKTLLAEDLMTEVNEMLEEARQREDWRGGVAIAEHLGLPVMELQNVSAEALGRIGDRQAIPVLLQVAKSDQSGRVRPTAIEALGKLGAIEAIPYLSLLLQEQPSDYDNACYIVLALQEIGTGEALSVLRKWEASWTDQPATSYTRARAWLECKTDQGHWEYQIYEGDLLVGRELIQPMLVFLKQRRAACKFTNRSLPGNISDSVRKHIRTVQLDGDFTCLNVADIDAVNDISFNRFFSYPGWRWLFQSVRKRLATYSSDSMRLILHFDK